MDFLYLGRNIATSSRATIILCGIAVCFVLTLYPKTKKRPQTAHHSRRRMNTEVNVIIPASDTRPFDILNSADTPTPGDIRTIDESKNLLSLLYSIAEDKAQMEGIVHRSIVL
jgi:hypothetical protein